jgi:hypothetical protein
MTEPHRQRTVPLADIVLRRTSLILQGLARPKHFYFLPTDDAAGRIHYT